MSYCTECESEVSRLDRFCAEYGNRVDASPTDSRDTESKTEATDDPVAEVSKTSSEPWSRNANWVHGGRAVGGKLNLYNDRIVFNSHSVEQSEGLFSVMGFAGKYLGLVPEETYQAGTVNGTEISFEKIEEVEKEPPRQRGLRDTLYAGGLRTRLKTTTSGDEEELFIMNSVEDVKNDIEDAVLASDK